MHLFRVKNKQIGLELIVTQSPISFYNDYLNFLRDKDPGPNIKGGKKKTRNLEQEIGLSIGQEIGVRHPQQKIRVTTKQEIKKVIG